ncbi:MAG: diacylglycerol/lipid kinase family protein [Acidimicrobiia bacterium]
MRILLIVNATASSVTARRRVIIQKALGADHDLEVVETSRRGHAARLARGAAADGVEVVAVLAGDGTLNEAADGLVGTETALAPLPGGSTNVYARSLGIPEDPVEAAGQLLDALERKSFRRIGLGRIGDRHFLFHCGVGFDAAVVESVERRAAFKRYAAHPLFVLAAFDTWLRTYDHSHGRFAVTFPDGETVPDATFVIISKTSPYTYLGHRPIVVAPAATLDSALSFTIIRSRHTPSILSVVARAFLSTKALHRQRDVVQRDGVTAATISSSEEPFPYQVDGDYLGDVRRLDVAFVPDALTLVAP